MCVQSKAGPDWAKHVEGIPNLFPLTYCVLAIPLPRSEQSIILQWSSSHPFQKSDHPVHWPATYSTGMDRSSEFSLLTTIEVWGNFVAPHHMVYYRIRISESGVAHCLCWLHAACPMESISQGASAGKIWELPGDIITSDTHILTIPHSTVLRNMASQHQTCKDTTDRRRRRTNRQSLCVASGDFNFAKRPFVLNYGIRSKACVSWPLSLATGSDTRTHPISVLWRISCLSLCFKLS